MMCFIGRLARQTTEWNKLADLPGKTQRLVKTHILQSGVETSVIFRLQWGRNKQLNTICQMTSSEADLSLETIWWNLVDLWTEKSVKFRLLTKIKTSGQAVYLHFGKEALAANSGHIVTVWIMSNGQFSPNCIFLFHLKDDGKNPRVFEVKSNSICVTVF